MGAGRRCRAKVQGGAGRQGHASRLRKLHRTGLIAPRPPLLPDPPPTPPQLFLAPANTSFGVVQTIKYKPTLGATNGSVT